MKTSSCSKRRSAAVLLSGLLALPILGSAESAFEQLALATRSAPIWLAQTRAPKTVYERCVESVVQIVVGNESGAGSIIDRTGLIMTNAHVVGEEDGRDGGVLVNLFALQPDGSVKKIAELEGIVVGKDDDRDLAVIRINTTLALKPLPFGDSDRLAVQDKVYTLGSPYQLVNSFAQGIVSGVKRVISGRAFIQTDAEINPGNSGGPLLNDAGEQVGMNTLTISGESGDTVGMAIPINRLKGPIQQILETGKTTKVMIGIKFGLMEKPVKCALTSCGYAGSFGVMVTGVTKGRAAEKGGIKIGDVLSKINGSEIVEPSDIPVIINELQPGQVVSFEVFRGGKTFTVKVAVEDADASPQDSAELVAGPA